MLNLKPKDQVKVVMPGGEMREGTLVQVVSRVNRYDVELDNYDYSKTNFHFHSFKKGLVTLK